MTNYIFLPTTEITSHHSSPFNCFNSSSSSSYWLTTETIAVEVSPYREASTAAHPIMHTTRDEEQSPDSE